MSLSETTGASIKRLGAAAILVGLAGMMMVSCSGDASDSQGPSIRFEGVTAQLLGFPDSSDEAYLFEENQVADCMSEFGFDYVPDLSGRQVPLDPNSREFAEKYGLGISTPDSANEYALVTDTPNARTLSALAPALRERWMKAESGCRDSAILVLEERTTNAYSRLDESAKQAISEFLFGTDQAGLDAEAAWSGCLGGAGYRFATFAEMESAIRDEFDLVTGDPAQVESLQRREIELAIKSHDCWVEHVGPVLSAQFSELDALVSQQLAIESLYQESWPEEGDQP